MTGTQQYLVDNDIQYILYVSDSSNTLNSINQTHAIQKVQQWYESDL